MPIPPRVRARPGPALVRGCWLRLRVGWWDPFRVLRPQVAASVTRWTQLQASVGACGQHWSAARARRAPPSGAAAEAAARPPSAPAPSSTAERAAASEPGDAPDPTVAALLALPLTARVALNDATLAVYSAGPSSSAGWPASMAAAAGGSLAGTSARDGEGEASGLGGHADALVPLPRCLRAALQLGLSLEVRRIESRALLRRTARGTALAVGLLCGRSRTDG
jgi:hypothetical protein